jgi:hypothetical protein
MIKPYKFYSIEDDEHTWGYLIIFVTKIIHKNRVEGVIIYTDDSGKVFEHTHIVGRQLTPDFEEYSSIFLRGRSDIYQAVIEGVFGEAE